MLVSSGATASSSKAKGKTKFLRPDRASTWSRKRLEPSAARAPRGKDEDTKHPLFPSFEATWAALREHRPLDVVFALGDPELMDRFSLVRPDGSAFSDRSQRLSAADRATVQAAVRAPTFEHALERARRRAIANVTRPPRVLGDVPGRASSRRTNFLEGDVLELDALDDDDDDDSVAATLADASAARKQQSWHGDRDFFAAVVERPRSGARSGAPSDAEGEAYDWVHGRVRDFVTAVLGRWIGGCFESFVEDHHAGARRRPTSSAKPSKTSKTTTWPRLQPWVKTLFAADDDDADDADNEAAGHAAMWAALEPLVWTMHAYFSLAMKEIAVSRMRLAANADAVPILERVLDTEGQGGQQGALESVTYQLTAFDADTNEEYVLEPRNPRLAVAQALPYIFWTTHVNRSNMPMNPQFEIWAHLQMPRTLAPYEADLGLPPMVTGPEFLAFMDRALLRDGALDQYLWCAEEANEHTGEEAMSAAEAKQRDGDVFAAGIHAILLVLLTNFFKSGVLEQLAELVADVEARTGRRVPRTTVVWQAALLFQELYFFQALEMPDFEEGWFPARPLYGIRFHHDYVWGPLMHDDDDDGGDGGDGDAED